jgi:hypothetical protein
MVKRHPLAVLLVIVGLLLFAVSVQAINMAPKLHSDPFEQPDLLLQQTRELEIEVKPEASSWQPRLRATMRSAHGAMVNIDGDIIGIGEEINGFRLLEVQERSATFSKDGKKFPVSLDDVADQ